MCNRDYLLGLSIYLLTTLSWAGQPIRDPSNCNNAYILTVSGGPIWTRNDKTQTFALQSDVTKTYTGNKQYRSNGMVEVFVGAQEFIEDGFLGQLGLAYGFAQNKISGEIWEDADPIFNDFDYVYPVNSSRFMLKTKFVIDAKYHLQYYLSADLGLSLNRAQSFKITPRIPEAVPAPAFQSHSTFAVAYALGVGLQLPLSKYWQAGIGYEFSDWGASTLSRAHQQTLNNGLNFNHLYTQALLFSVSLLF